MSTRARLTSLSNYTPGQAVVRGGNVSSANSIVIEFPTMPSVIELARSTEYAVMSVFTMPDGFHQFQWTNPLIIPFNFSLHRDSNLCPKGGLTLLEIAAQLHALTLPISNSTRGVATSVTPAPAPAKGTPEAEAQQAQQTSSPSTTVTGLDHSLDNTVFTPVSCWLDLISTGPGGPGISCIGYVKDVNVKLHEPFSEGPNGAYNIPTRGEYSFNFVHLPSKTNGRPGAGQGSYVNVQAYGDDVKSKLYNSLDLIKFAGDDLTFRGFNQ